jgi:hypothetical protein
MAARNRLKSEPYLRIRDNRCRDFCALISCRSVRAGMFMTAIHSSMNYYVNGKHCLPLYGRENHIAHELGAPSVRAQSSALSGASDESLNTYSCPPSGIDTSAPAKAAIP